MIKICYIVLTLATGEPALVNFNEVSLVNVENSAFSQGNRVYFKNGVVGNYFIKVKENALEVAEKVKQCTSPRSDQPFVYVIE